jgi:hypothetical protein
VRSRWPPNLRMEPTRQSVSCEHVTAARGSFVVLGRQGVRSST